MECKIHKKLFFEGGGGQYLFWRRHFFNFRFTVLSSLQAARDRQKGGLAMENKLPKWVRIYLALLGGAALLCVVAAAVWFARAEYDARREEGPRYLLKDNGGYLALYTAEGTGPLAEYDLRIRLLPEQDVLALQQGVPVEDEAELQQRLEDYGL